MSGVNKVILIGRLGKEPNIYSTANGRMARFSLATSETWKDKTTGEKKEVTDWHSVVVTNQGLIDIVEKYLHKGNMVYIEGRLKEREIEENGKKITVTDVLLSPYNGELVLMEKQQ